VTTEPYSELVTREYRSEFRPEHGVWVLKRVERDTQDSVPEAVRVPSAASVAPLRVVEDKPAARS
jgi:hypothetical protein